MPLQKRGGRAPLHAFAELIPQLAQLERTRLVVPREGQVVGQGDSPEGSRGFLWENDEMVDLGVLPGGTWAVAAAIDDEGRVAGFGDSDEGLRAFLWEDGVMAALEPRPGASTSDGYGINNAGQVVGESGSRAVLRWTLGGDHGLEVLAAGARLSRARSTASRRQPSAPRRPPTAASATTTRPSATSTTGRRSQAGATAAGSSCCASTTVASTPRSSRSGEPGRRGMARWPVSIAMKRRWGRNGTLRWASMLPQG
jgi:probable HAF family extracellular repeat protein